MRTISFTSKTLGKYRETVKGNENISRKQAELKMTRNMLLAHEESRGNKGGYYYRYGCLHFIVVNDRVVWLQNGLKPHTEWKKDIGEYLRLSKKLGIESDETYIGLWLEMKIAEMKYLKNKMKWKLKLTFK